MKAWRVHDFGEPKDCFVLDEVPEPTAADLAGMSMGLGGWVPCGPGLDPFDDWVIMRMGTAALALPDVTMCRGTYPVPVVRPYVSGQEGVGIVEESAPSRRHLLGKRVVACTIQPWGSLAPVAVGISMIFEVPEQMSDEQAAGFLIASHTAYHAAIRRGRVASGETVAVLGAAGGLGSAIVQLCLAQGARVIAIVGGAEKAAFCRELGADAVDHTSGDFVAAVRQLADGGVDVVMDPVQGQMGALATSLLVPNGRRVLCGHAGGLIPHDPDFYLYNHTLVGVDLGGYPRDVMQQFHVETHDALTELLADGRYRPIVDQRVGFGEVPDALEELAARHTIGRTVVEIPQDVHAR
ncbi:MAG: zinc-binding dehydrogenase [Acidimicrobiales bacterium]